MRALVNQTETKRGGINKSIQVHSTVRYSDICHMYYGSVRQDCDLGWHCWPCVPLFLQKCARTHTRTTVESNDLPRKRTEKVQRCKGYRRCYFTRFVEKVLQSINLTKRPEKTQCVSPSLNTFKVPYHLCGSPKPHLFLLKGYIYKNRS